MRPAGRNVWSKLAVVGSLVNRALADEIELENQNIAMS
jgi:hypothetical protein